MTYNSAIASKNHCRNYLPHIEDKQCQFITFRLYDSLPQSVIDYYRATLIYLKNKDITSDVYEKKTKECLSIIAKYEDSGYGQCFFRDERIAELMANTLHYHNNTLYQLLEWCIMPNHIHVMINMNKDSTLSQILHTWRSFTASKGNEILGRKGKFWMNEYFDRYIRDYDHGIRVSSYIKMNPVKAGLVSKPEDWRWSSIWKG
jgi:REP element-mobilizing transposase RayT